MSRLQKRLQREADIIHATIELLDTSSFMDLRMSDIARAAECSMGAIYSHFTSKEDLLLGCAHCCMKEKYAMLNKLVNRNYDSLELLMMVSFTTWINDERQPKIHQLVQLAMNPSVWQRASATRIADMNALGREMKDIIAGYAINTLGTVSEKPIDRVSAEHFCLGTMGLTTGIYTIKVSGFGCFEEELQEADGVELHLTNLKHYLTGWGFDLNALPKSLEEIRKNAEVFCQQEYS